MENKRKSKRKIAAVVFVIVVAAIVTGYFSTVYAVNPETEEETLLREYPVKRGDITAGVDGSGLLAAEGTPHSFKIGGELEDIYVKVGDYVKEGDELAKMSEQAINDKLRELYLELDKAKVTLDNAKASKKEVTGSSEVDRKLERSGDEPTRSGAMASEVEAMDAGAEKFAAEEGGQQVDTGALESAIAEAESAIAALSTEAANLRGQITAMETQLLELETKVKEIDETLTALPEDDPQRNELTLLRDEYVKQYNETLPLISGLYNDLNAKQGELDAAYTSLNELRAKLNAANGDKNQSDGGSDQGGQLNYSDGLNGFLGGNEGMSFGGGGGGGGGNSSSQKRSLENDILLAELNIEEIERKIEETKAQKKDLVLKAQHDGYVLETGYSKGAETSPEKSVVTLGGEKDIYASMQVAQSDIGDIEEGQLVELTFDAWPEQSFTGKVIHKMPLPVKDSNPVSYQVKVALDEKDSSFLQGMTCSATFILKRVEDVIQLSNKAIRMVDGKQVVLMKDEEGNTYEQEIKTGFSDGRVSEIKSGLSEGDVVYVED